MLQRHVDSTDITLLNEVDKNPLNQHNLGTLKYGTRIGKIEKCTPDDKGGSPTLMTYNKVTVYYSHVVRGRENAQKPSLVFNLCGDHFSQQNFKTFSIKL